MSFQTDPNKSTFSASPTRSLGTPLSAGRYDFDEPRSIADVIVSPVRNLLAGKRGIIAFGAVLAGLAIFIFS